MNKSIGEKKIFYSFEYFPPKTPAGVENLYTRMDRMALLEVSCLVLAQCSIVVDLSLC